MAKTFTADDTVRLSKSYVEIGELKKFILARAEVYSAMKRNEPVRLRNENGYSHNVKEYQIFSPDADFDIMECDAQGRGSWNVKFKVPRAFVFGEPSAEEKEFIKYLELKDKFGDKK